MQHEIISIYTIVISVYEPTVSSFITVNNSSNKYLWACDHLWQKFFFEKDIHLKLSTLIGQFMKKASCKAAIFFVTPLHYTISPKCKICLFLISLSHQCIKPQVYHAHVTEQTECRQWHIVMDDSEISTLDLIRLFWKKNLISNYERFLPPIKDLSDACAQWLVRLAWPLLCQYFSDSYACEPTIQYGRLAKI